MNDDILTITQRLENHYEEVDDLSAAYYEAKTKYEALERNKKTMLATCELLSQSKTQAAITRDALNDPMYTSHLAGLDAAAQKYNQATASFEALKMKISILQSINKHLN